MAKTSTVKKPILLSELSRFSIINKVVLESLEQALYRVVIEVDGQEYYVLEKPNKTLTRRSIVAVQELLQPYIIGEMYLSHQSAYDEMIGHEVNHHGNELLVPIGDYFNRANDQKIH